MVIQFPNEFFKEAIEEDPEYARAYAAIAIASYSKDAGKTEKG